MTDRTEHPAAPTDGVSGEGQEGLSKEGTA